MSIYVTGEKAVKFLVFQLLQPGIYVRSKGVTNNDLRVTSNIERASEMSNR